MSRRPTPRLLGYSALVLLGGYAAVVVARVEALALVAPFALWLALGLVLSETPQVQVELSLERDRVAEDASVDLVGRVRARGRVGWIELRARLPEAFGCDPESAAFRIRPMGGDEVELRWRLVPRRWGVYRLGPVVVTAQDPLGLLRHSTEVGVEGRLRVYPALERLRRLVPPSRTQLSSGNRIARRAGEGIEFADIRSFVPGDRVRRVNWRATARTGTPHVNDFHLERNADVVLFIDSFVEVGVERESVLTLAVRAAVALADGYLGVRDRVGVVGFGGILNWLRPGLGPRQFYRVVDALLDTHVVTSYAWKAIDIIPPRVLPAASTVLALSPLLDPRSLGALVDLHHRGFDLAVLEIAPEAFLAHGRVRADPLALRLWHLVRESRRRSLQRSGLVVLEWRPEVPLEVLLAQVREYRRFARRSAA
ncbi:MAG: DUF58 domain-containing protein [Candidatus Dormibacteria bacterium]